MSEKERSPREGGRLFPRSCGEEPFDTALDFSRGDLKTDSRGIPYSVTGEEELLQRIRVCLSVPKGSFVYESGLGSRLREAHDPPELLEAAREALGPIPEAEPIRAQWQGELCLVELRLPGGCRAVEIRR